MPSFAADKAAVSSNIYTEYLYDIKLSDVKLVVVNTKGQSVGILANRLVLADKSQVFKRMFRSELPISKASSKSDTVICLPMLDVTDKPFQEKPVRAMIEFMYTNSIITDLETVGNRKQLYDLAEKYDIACLSAVAVKGILQKDLNVDNVFAMLDFAWKYSDKSLWQACYDYLRKNYTGCSDEVLEDAMEHGGAGVRKSIVMLLKKL
ncbi:hypothetical protein SeMB42_g02335 [Synchytrium endobioticum]|uniref:BTB domain-containing protein n=1 Tax=Synchytrium endobioticum TaxID=286115 RepID=A0A507D734_9FUNG|nr:hypothetical protein SeLEV6574_g03125 [Synchytrium endobioticum]TPX50224.1 hypothetical protein SeMB42_g02335 [Synchytrium endobioticum]